MGLTRTGDAAFRHRLLGAVVLCAVLGGLFVHSAATEDARTPYPEADELSAGYDDYVGESILVFGRVTAVQSDGLTIRAESAGESVRLRVTDAAADVAPGGVVQVYGELRADGRLAAQRVVVVNRSVGAQWYKYAVSILGALGFLVAFARHWRLDRETWTLEARDG